MVMRIVWTMVVVVPVVMLAMTMMVVMTMMLVVVLEQPSAGEVHDEPDDRDGDGLAEVDGNGVGQTQQALPPDQQGDERQNDRAGEAGEIAELARAEGEPWIAGVPTGVEVRQRR